MVTTGYADTFGRTVASGLGVATSGQTYSLFGTASLFSVAPNVASMTINAGNPGDKIGYIDRQTYDIDITGQVALSVIPATNLATVGFVGKMSSTSNYYNAAMMVATGGAVSLRFSKVAAGSLTTLATVATGLTYVANTFYNLRVAMYWSNALQANVLQSKLWAVGATEPGGWMASTTDSAFTQYTAGTLAGFMVHDEETTPSIVGKIQNVAAKTYGLPMPALTDTMCADPSVAYPKQTALQSLAVAADTAAAALRARATLAGLSPRVRVSKGNLTFSTAPGFITATFDTVEFNIGTPTNLSFDPTAIYLPVGIWMITFEVRLGEAASNSLNVFLGGGPAAGQVEIFMRSNAAQSNDQFVGGCGHFSSTTFVTDPTTPLPFIASFAPTSLTTSYNIQYMALSAIKISDYFA